MISSFTILLTSLAFLIFGYLSLLRIIHKRHFENFELGDDSLRYHFRAVHRGFSKSALFVSFPAISLLLFWGWAAAVLWLIIFHLLVETVVNLQLSTAAVDSKKTKKKAKKKTKKKAKKKTQKVASKALFDETSKSTSEYGSKQTLTNTLLSINWQLYLILLITVVITLLSDLIDKQSGLLFALIALIPAHSLLSHQSALLPKPSKMIGALFIFLFGLVFADQLGISIYGNVTPFLTSDSSQPWFIFNNMTIIALGLVIAGLMLSRNTSFNDHTSKLVGSLLVFIFIIVLVKLLWLRPLLDAPLSSLQQRSTELPNFATVCLLLFTGLTSTLLQPKPPLADYATDTETIKFSKLQITSLAQLLFSLVLVLALASALGIGAWKTHYLDWQNGTDLVTHFNLIIASILSLIDADSRLGAASYTLFMSAMAITGFSLLIRLFARLDKFSVLTETGAPANKQSPASVEHTESFKDALTELLFNSKIAHAIIIYLLSSWLINHGISVNLWLIISMFAWLLLTHTILEATLRCDRGKVPEYLQCGLCTVLILFGAIQTLWTGILWAINGYWLNTLFALAILIMAALLWWQPIVLLIEKIKALTTPAAPQLFDN